MESNVLTGVNYTTIPCTHSFCQGLEETELRAITLLFLTLIQEKLEYRVGRGQEGDFSSPTPSHSLSPRVLQGVPKATPLLALP